MRIQLSRHLDTGDEADGQRHGKADPRRPHIHDFGQGFDPLDGHTAEGCIRLVRDLRRFPFIKVPVIALAEHSRQREDPARQELEASL